MLLPRVLQRSGRELAMPTPAGASWLWVPPSCARLHPVNRTLPRALSTSALPRRARELAMPPPAGASWLWAQPPCARLHVANRTLLPRALSTSAPGGAPGDVRLIGEDGKVIGIVSHAEATALAAERQVSLQEVAPKASPPVWKLIPKGVAKPKPDPEKAAKEAQLSGAREAMRRRAKLSKAARVKELRITDRCQEHDALVKLRNAHQFLLKGNVVKVVVMSTNLPDQSRSSQAGSIIQRFIDDTAQIATSNGKTGKGQMVTTVLTPK